MSRIENSTNCSSEIIDAAIESGERHEDGVDEIIDENINTSSLTDEDMAIYEECCRRG